MVLIRIHKSLFNCYWKYSNLYSAKRFQLRNCLVTIALLILSSCQKEDISRTSETSYSRFNYKLKQGRYVVISYDDSPKTDYTLLKDLHVKLQIPAEIGVWTNKVSKNTVSIDSITTNNLHELIKNGFNLVNHSKDHLSLGRTTLLTDHNEGETLIYTNTASAYQLAKGKILDAYHNKEFSSSYTLKSIKILNNRFHLEIEPGLDKTLTKNDFLILNESELKNQISSSQEFLESNFQVREKHFSLPFGLLSPESEKIFDLDNFKTVRLATPNRNAEKVTWIYQNEIQDLFNINSLDLLYLNPLNFQSEIDKLTSDRVFLILFTHSWDQNFSEKKLNEIVNILKLNGFQFTTRNEYFSE